jgi:hypothetical protein
MGFGRSSLLSFTLANMLLIVLHPHINVGAYTGLALLPAYAFTVLLVVGIIERSTVALKRSSLTLWVHKVGAFPGSHVITLTTSAVLNLLNRLYALPRKVTG